MAWGSRENGNEELNTMRTFNSSKYWWYCYREWENGAVAGEGKVRGRIFGGGWWWFSWYVVSDSCDPTDCTPPDSSVHGILQARILEWVAIFSSRGSSQPRDQALVSCIAGGFFMPEPPGKPTEGLLSLFWGPLYEWRNNSNFYANVSDPVERNILKMQETTAETTLLSGWAGMGSRTLAEGWPQMGTMTFNPYSQR